LETFRQSFLYKYSNSSSDLTPRPFKRNRRTILHCRSNKNIDIQSKVLQRIALETFAPFGAPIGPRAFQGELTFLLAACFDS
jgi:hypothetical protein